MTTDQLLDNVMADLRALFRQEPRLAGVTRYALDLLLGDFERRLRDDLDELDAQIERDIQLEVDWAREDWDQEQAERAAAKSRKKQTKVQHDRTAFQNSLRANA